jgi:hypothetical protein
MNWKIACVLAACAATLLGQTPPVTIMEILVENTVMYVHDSGDQPRIASTPTVVPLASEAQRAFKLVAGFGDIVAVNGKPARGSWAVRTLMYYCGTGYTPGRMIADISCGCAHDEFFAIQQADGTPVGSIVVIGYGGGPPEPGAPTMLTATTTAVAGGTGPFLGARGQAGWARYAEGAPMWRWASMLEDPANRRVNGGGRYRSIIHLIPMTLPEVLTGATGPSVFHADDFSRVTAEKPTRAGELLVMSVSGLGPVRPNLDPGKPSPPGRPARSTRSTRRLM